MSDILDVSETFCSHRCVPPGVGTITLDLLSELILKGRTWDAKAVWICALCGRQLADVPPEHWRVVVEVGEPAVIPMRVSL